MTTITFWYTESGRDGQAMQTLIAAFEQQNPRIHVTARAIDLGSATDSYLATARHGNAPDVMRADVGAMNALATAGVIRDLAAYHVDTTDFAPGPLAAATFQGKLYGLPQETDLLVLYYNSAALASAGVAHPPQTWSDFDAANKALTRNGRFGWEFPDSTYFAEPFLFSFGGGIVDGGARPQPLINSAGSMKGLLFLKQELAYTPRLDPANGYGETVADFKAGKTAMMIGGSWEYSNLLTGPAFAAAHSLGIAALPYDHTIGDIARTPGGGQAYVLSKRTRHADAAYQLMSFLVEPANQAFLAARNHTLPARLSAYRIQTMRDNPEFAAFAPLLRTQKALPAMAKGNILYNADTQLDMHLRRFLVGQEDVKTATNNMARAVSP